MMLKCMRCGSVTDLDPAEMYGWGLCGACWDKHPSPTLNPRHFHRWMERWQKCGPRHPTWIALGAAMDRLLPEGP